MDQLHLPPDLYRDLRDQSNAGVSAWLGTLVGLRRWSKKQLRAGSVEDMSSRHGVFYEKSESDRT
jgi:hypothetical protein